MPDWGPALSRLGLAAQDWGPNYRGTYAQLLASWRGVSALPSETSLQAELDAFAAEQAARDLKAEAIDKVQGDPLNPLKGLIAALNDGTFVPGSSYTAAQVKAKIKAKM